LIPISFRLKQSKGCIFVILVYFDAEKNVIRKKI
jgi:hypothetical protein